MQDWLARGQYPISFGLSPRDVDDMHDQGLPAKSLGLLDGTGAIVGGFGVMCLFDQPPHPNAAKLFLNWMASPDGMAVHAQAEGQVPLRKDVEHPWAKEEQVPKEGVAYQDLYDYHYIMDQKPAIIRRIREIMGQ
jgi:ABC-type Fe3+ transport system substrate-binding protein